ncbi:hypothetical protein J6590_049608 [Homalodisca vitripennis]|nr:hypothetical protein J6590_049608 [Homalodisca vitripennis]
MALSVSPISPPSPWKWIRTRTPTLKQMGDKQSNLYNVGDKSTGSAETSGRDRRYTAAGPRPMGMRGTLTGATAPVVFERRVGYPALRP